jgi:hypothetical protein
METILLAEILLEFMLSDKRIHPWSLVAAKALWMTPTQDPARPLHEFVGRSIHCPS